MLGQRKVQPDLGPAEPRGLNDLQAPLNATAGRQACWGPRSAATKEEERVWRGSGFQNLLPCGSHWWSPSLVGKKLRLGWENLWARSAGFTRSLFGPSAFTKGPWK